MTVTLAVQRFNPEVDSEPYVVEYNVEVEGSDRVIDALLYIAENEDSTLSFRKSCVHGVCGSDAMRINGVEKLACKTLIHDVVDEENTRITVEPLEHYDIKRDLIVDYDVFMDKYSSVRPYFVPAAPPPEQEYIQSQEDRLRIDEATKCINCGACYSACPILDTNPNFLGPQALVQAIRFVNDSRDAGLEARLDVLDNPNGIWGCEQKFECTKVCPRDIKITKLINKTKRTIEKYRTDRGETPNKGEA